MDEWGLEKDRPRPQWPEGAEPAFLEHVSGNPVDVQMELGLLEAYGIPVVLQYPNNGVLGNVVLGFAGGGVDLYVPVEALEDAKNIISGAPISEEGAEGETHE